MAFLEIEDLKTVIRDYQLDAITDSDDTIADEAIESAIEEVSSILTPNDMKLWDDGRPKYDVAAIFATTGTGRPKLMLTHTKAVAMWHLIALADSGLQYDDAEGRYDRAIKYLKDLASGTINSATLPKVTAPPPEDKQPFGFGSRPKFNHDY